MHRSAIKRTTKNELPPESQYTCNGVCRAASRNSAVPCDRRYVCRDCRVPTAVHVQRRMRTVNLQTDFLFRSRDVVLTMNSVKILHAVRSAITAIAELLVTMHSGGLHSGSSQRLATQLSWWCSGLASDFWSIGHWFDSRLGRYQVDYVNSAFHPSVVGKSSTSLHGCG